MAKNKIATIKDRNKCRKEITDGLAGSLHLNDRLKDIQDSVEKVKTTDDDKTREDLRKQLNKKLAEKENSHFLMYLDYHSVLYESVNDESLCNVAVDMAEQLIDEYDCKSASEITLCQIIANSYCRYMLYSKRNVRGSRLESVDSDINSYYNLVNKETDRALKQYIQALNTLRMMKQPKMNVNIRTNQAFVAQNQQLNSIENDKPK